jgi:hypothetical protein
LTENIYADKTNNGMMEATMHTSMEMKQRRSRILARAFQGSRILIALLTDCMAESKTLYKLITVPRGGLITY